VQVQQLAQIDHATRRCLALKQLSR